MEKRHFFTHTEKKEFLKILRKYGPIIETKCNDGNTLRRKTIAWNRIACEYNTSSIAPYPASSKQLRRLWMNIKQRNKVSLQKQEHSETTASDAEDSLDVANVEEEISTPYFVNVEGSENPDDLLKTSITGGNPQENETFNATDSEERAFNVEFIDETEEDVKPKQQPVTQKGANRVKNNLIVREYQDRRHRQNELHLLQKRLLLEQIREARAKANLAELELRQHQYLE